MIGVDRIDDVRRLGRSGASVASIARDTGVSEPTVRECLREPDLSERPPVVGRAPGVAPARAVRGAGGLVAARGQAPLVQTAPHREEGVRQADGGSYATVRRYVRRRGGGSRPSSTPGRRRGSRRSTGSPASARWTSGRRTSACAASSRGGWRWPTHSSAPPVSVRAGWGQGVFFSVAKRAKTR